MARPHEFNATIQSGGMGGAFVVIPFDAEEAFGSKRPRVKATFDGIPYRGTAVRMGSPDHLIIIRKEIREQIGKQPGDEVVVTMELDSEPRTVELPDDFADGLKPHKEARSFFDGLSYTHKKEYVRWITEAKQAETRERRIMKSIEMLRNQKKTPD